jgi:hypothetical protein
MPADPTALVPNSPAWHLADGQTYSRHRRAAAAIRSGATAAAQLSRFGMPAYRFTAARGSCTWPVKVPGGTVDGRPKAVDTGHTCYSGKRGTRREIGPQVSGWVKLCLSNPSSSGCHQLPPRVRRLSRSEPGCTDLRATAMILARVAAHDFVAKPVTERSVQTSSRKPSGGVRPR